MDEDVSEVVKLFDMSKERFDRITGWTQA